MVRTPIRLIVLAGAFGLAFACGPKQIEYNSNSGSDGVRDTATQLHLNTSEDDRCNAETGDNEDWRYMLIEKPGVLKVSVRVDNPRIDADLYLHDGYGRPVDRINITESSDFYEFKDLSVPVGRYYFRIACRKGQSVYTVSALFEEPEQVAEPAQVFVVEAEEPEEPKVKKKRRKKKKEEPKKEEPKKEEPKKEEPKKEEPVKEEPVVPDVPPKKIVGTITLVTPGDGGKAKIVIRGVGSKFGVDTSMKGKLKGRGKTVSLFDCSSSKCQGIVEADEEELKEFNKVEFMVPGE